VTRTQTSGQYAWVAASDDVGTRGTWNTVFIVVALAGAATPVAIAAFARNRLWHEGVDGFFVAVAFSVLVVRSGQGTWQQRLAKTLLILAAVTVSIVIALGVFLLASISRNGFPP
jgi:ABC-type proline/glycine betaine transport system permease subunit